MKEENKQKKAYYYASVVVLLWATVASAFKISLKHLNYIQLLFWASLASTTVLCGILLIQRKEGLLRALAKKDIFDSAGLGFLNPFLYYLVLFKAYSLLRAQEAQPLNQTWVIILSILSIIILKQRIRLVNIIAVCVSFLGVVIISTRGDFTRLSFTNLTGVILAIGSAIIWAVYWIYNIKDRCDEVLKLFLNFLFGSLYSLVLVLITGGIYIPAWQGMIGAIYVGFCEMGITFVLWLRALRLSETTAKISNLIYVVPFISLIMIRIVVGETILLSSVIGLIFIIAGILLQQYERKR